MALKKVPQSHAPVITVTSSEILTLTSNLTIIQGVALRALNLLETIDARAANEFAESMKIIRGLQPEEPKGGGQ